MTHRSIMGFKKLLVSHSALILVTSTQFKPTTIFSTTMDSSKTIEQALASVVASATTLDLLRDLHTQALAESAYVSTDSQPASAALDRFVALEPEKCALVYLLLRAAEARFVVEAGTSFGVSTIYLALAVSQNAVALNATGKVIATENEIIKAERARLNWSSCGDDIGDWIELRDGDLLETLKSNLPEQIDFVLLDSEFVNSNRAISTQSDLLE